MSTSSNQSRFSRERNSSPHSPDESSHQNRNDILNDVLGSPTFQNKPLLPYKEWNIDISEVEVGTLIGRGKRFFLLSSHVECFFKFIYPL